MILCCRSIKNLDLGWFLYRLGELSQEDATVLPPGQNEIPHAFNLTKQYRNRFDLPSVQNLGDKVLGAILQTNQFPLDYTDGHLSLLPESAGRKEKHAC